MIGGKSCSICSSDRYIENHHYDCLGGKLSPETVPLCKRCHRSYHIWGVGCFSPDTTEKALEVENKRREILCSLPLDHPQRRWAVYLGYLEPLRLEDVKRSGYWYRKWGIKPPIKEKERALVQRMHFSLPNKPPLCGKDWLRDHLNDHTTEEIGALRIEITCDGDRLPPVLVADKRNTLKRILKEATVVG